MAELKGALAGVKLPLGYTLEVGGQYESQRRAFRELLLVFGGATALVFLVLVVQFRRFTPSALILVAAPLSLGGAFALLLATRTELNVSSAMGLILLVGLIVKNGIVMLDYAHHLHDGGMPLREAVPGGCPREATADPDDDFLHALRAAPAGTRPRRRRGIAATPCARRDRRADALVGSHALSRASAVPRAGTRQGWAEG